MGGASLLCQMKSSAKSSSMSSTRPSFHTSSVLRAATCLLVSGSPTPALVAGTPQLSTRASGGGRTPNCWSIDILSKCIVFSTN